MVDLERETTAVSMFEKQNDNLKSWCWIVHMSVYIYKKEENHAENWEKKMKKHKR